MIPQAHVVHHIPGRMRVKLPYAKGNYKLLERIKDSVSPLPGVQQVATNPVTGSVLVYYDPDQHEDFHSHLARHAEDASLFALRASDLLEAKAIISLIEEETEFLAAQSDTARSILGFFKRLNQDVKRTTNNAFDLRLLLPLGLAGYAFFGADKNLRTPLWVTLLIFSFNTFVTMNAPVPSPNVDASAWSVDLPQPARATSRTRKVANAGPKRTRRGG